MDIRPKNYVSLASCLTGKNQNDKCPCCKSKTRDFCYLQLGKSKIVLEPGNICMNFI